jgi:hypothetical protein
VPQSIITMAQESNQKNYLLRDQLLTREDLVTFKQELLQDLKNILQPGTSQNGKKWFKSHEVIAMLGISRGTLQNLRNNGKLNSTRIGGLLFYDYDDIRILMGNQKHQTAR